MTAATPLAPWEARAMTPVMNSALWPPISDSILRLDLGARLILPEGKAGDSHDEQQQRSEREDREEGD
jgi:hypothetical protein